MGRKVVGARENWVLRWWAFEFLAVFAGLVRRPDVMIAAHALLFQLSNVFYLGLYGCGCAASVRVGLALGSDEPRRASLATRASARRVSPPLISLSLSLSLSLALCCS